MKNKLFSYKFRNESCVYPTKCGFPTTAKPYQSPNGFVAVGIAIFGGLGVGTALVLIIKYIERCKCKCMK